MRADLCAEAIRLAKLLCVLMPDEPEAFGLLALLLLQDSRREARVGPDGELVLLADQDRARWDRRAIDEGLRVLRRAEATRTAGPVPAPGSDRGRPRRGRRSRQTDRRGRTTRCSQIDPSPVVRLNRAVADRARGRRREGPRPDRRGSRSWTATHYLHAARADLLRRLGRDDEAAASYRAALALTDNAPERRFLEGRLREVEGRDVRA